MTDKQVASITVEELKDVIASVVDERLSAMKTSLLQEIADLIENNGKRREQALVYQEAYVLPKRTKEEQRKINQELLEWHKKWVEEGDEEEQRETFVETDGDEVVVATTNVGHLSRFVNAREWREIS